jgi:hypothetical protein
MKPKALPQEIYVNWEDASDEDPFLVARQSPDEHAELNSTVRVGVYRLQRIDDVKNSTTNTPTKKTKGRRS